MAEASTLYVVATPIGNLRDITLRALDVLRSVTLVAAEDTRHTRRLLDHYDIAAKTLAVHEHNEFEGAARVADALAQGASVAYVTDAGTPGVSDPGARLVRQVRLAGHPVVPIPGPSAAIAALSVAGLDGTAFRFEGFLPPKAEARRAALQAFAAVPHAIVCYESPHRVRDALAAMVETCGAARRITLCRELTKVFESVHECPLGDVLEWLDADPNRVRGEFVLVLHPPVDDDGADTAREASRVLALLAEDLPASQAARLAAKITGARRNVLYAEALKLRGESDS